MTRGTGSLTLGPPALWTTAAIAVSVVGSGVAVLVGRALDGNTCDDPGAIGVVAITALVTGIAGPMAASSARRRRLVAAAVASLASSAFVVPVVALAWMAAYASSGCWS